MTWSCPETSVQSGGGAGEDGSGVTGHDEKPELVKHKESSLTVCIVKNQRKGSELPITRLSQSWAGLGGVTVE